MNRTRLVGAFFTLAFCTAALTAANPDVDSAAVLARVEVQVRADRLGLPLHALWLDGEGREYALTIASMAALKNSGAPFAVLAPHREGTRYVIGRQRRTGGREAMAGDPGVLLDDGKRLVMQWSEASASRLDGLGFAVTLLPEEPFEISAPDPPVDRPFAYDARVAAIVGAVQQDTVYDYVGRLSGETAVNIGGSAYTIATRHTNSGTPISKATQYVYEHMESRGYTVTYHNWATSRNVIGEKLGTVRPNEIVLITAHLDDVPSGGIAPGADDNASGSVALMLAADLMKDYYFERTYRLVFFTGEEQGLLGSSSYAAMVKTANQNIVAVYNMDMIAYDDTGGPTLRIHIRTPFNPGYSADLAIASVFTGVVNDYGLAGSLTPIIDADGETASDHSSFWQRGYAALLAIEDDVSDFNPRYHTVNDKRQYLNMPYFTAYVKASLGTAAHLAYPTTAPCQLGLTAKAAFLDGHSATGTSSNLNGIFEPGEAVLFAPTWEYPANCGPALVTATIANLVVPTGFAASIPDSAASYGTMSAGVSNNCRDKTGNCYVLHLSNPASRPATHVDVTVEETLTWGVTRTWTLHVGRSFTDVDIDQFYYPFVERILHHGVTLGCQPGMYCPNDGVRRQEMAAFISRAMAGGDGAVPSSGGEGDTAYDCREGGVSPFSDVSPTDYFCRHIGFILLHGITIGCGNGQFCPSSMVSRWQMGGFMARSIAGGNDNVPLAYAGQGGRAYSCDPANPNLHFTDVLIEDEFCKHIHYLWAKQVIDGCAPSEYCVGPDVTRGEMSKFLANGFNLVLYQP